MCRYQLCCRASRTPLLNDISPLSRSHKNELLRPVPRLVFSKSHLFRFAATFGERLKVPPVRRPPALINTTRSSHSNRDSRILCKQGLCDSQRIGDDVRKPVGRLWRSAILVSCGLLLIVSLSYAQQDDERGHSIGKVSANEGLIVMELDDRALGKASLFDLAGHTLRFTPEGSRYRVENGPLHWDSEFGLELTGAEARLHQFAFPFSGKLWNSFLVGTTGSIRFGSSEKDAGIDPYGHRDGGIVLDRFDELAKVAAKLIDRATAICVFLKPRMSGPHYLKELSDH